MAVQRGLIRLNGVAVMTKHSNFYLQISMQLALAEESGMVPLPSLDTDYLMGDYSSSVFGSAQKTLLMTGRCRLGKLTTVSANHSRRSNAGNWSLTPNTIKKWSVG